MTREQSISQLCTHLLEALETYDASISPHGLYAAGDLVATEGAKPRAIKRRHLNVEQRHQEWFAALKPFIESIDGKILSEDRYVYRLSDLPIFQFKMPDIGKIELKIAKISKIKVRQYGSSYHVDKHEYFNERWEELRMDRAISHLWASSAYRPEVVGILLFIGFDKAQRPFERELSQLKPHVKRDEHNIIFESRDWLDKVGRGFSIRTTIWAHDDMQKSDSI